MLPEPLFSIAGDHHQYIIYTTPSGIISLLLEHYGTIKKRWNYKIIIWICNIFVHFVACVCEFQGMFDTVSYMKITGSVSQ